MPRVSPIIVGAFSVLASILAVASLFVFAPADLSTFQEDVALGVRNPFVSLVGVATLSGVLLLVSSVAVKSGSDAGAQKRQMRVAVTACTLLLVTLGVLWTGLNPCMPYADQLKVWELASLLSGMPLPDTDMQELADYMNHYPPQRRMALAFSLLFRLLHSNSLYVASVLNVASLAWICLALCGLTWRLTRKPRAVVICACSITLFAPIILYTSFFYTTLLSAAMVFTAFLGLVAYLQEQRSPYLIALVLLPLANLLYTGTIIATAATCFALTMYLLEQRREGRHSYLALASLALLPLLFLGLTTLSDRAVDTMFQPAIGDGVPALAYVSMGMTSDSPTAVCGAGGFDGSNYALLDEHGMDTAKTSQAARERIATAIKQYATGERSLLFFACKTGHQWLDPWFSSTCLTCYLSGNQDAPSFANQLSSSGVFGATQLVLSFFLSMVYTFAGAGALFKLRTKELAPSHLVLEAFFLLGFCFLMVWEQKARYGLPYFLALIPLAALGIDCLGSVLRKRIDSLRAAHPSRPTS